jgi:hypothetical protein
MENQLAHLIEVITPALLVPKKKKKQTTQPLQNCAGETFSKTKHPQKTRAPPPSEDHAERKKEL